MKHILIIGLILTFGLKINAQIFDTSDENFIKYQVLLLVNKYGHLADLTEDGINFSENYKNAFKNIFVDTKSKSIYNDLQKKGDYISVEEYVKIVQDFFPHGIETEIDSTNIKFLQIQLIEGDKYSIELVADKNVVGITNANKIYNQKITAHFIVHFEYYEEEFDKFLFYSITNKETLLKKESDKQMRGFHIGANILPGISKLYMQGNYNDYKQTIGVSLSNSIGLSFHYYLNSNLGVSIGANYTVYKTKSNSEYNNNENNNLERTDMDGDNYFLYINSNINEQGKFIFLDIPIYFTYRYGLENKISFFASIGFINSLLQSSQFKVDGNSSQSGYYPEYDLLIDDASLYNFGSIDYNNDYPVNISSFQLMTSISGGMSLPIGTAGHLNAGLEYRQNITNLEYNTSAYRDDFVSINGIPKTSWMQFLSLSISYTHKLFDFSNK